MRAETGHLTFGEKGGYNLWRSFRTQYEAVDPGFAGTASRFAESRELEDRTPRVPVRAFSLFAAAPGAVAGDSLRRLLRLVFETLPLATHWPWFLLAILGWPALRLPALRPAVAVLVTMPFIYAPFSVDRRFLVPAVPLLLIPAAFFLETWRRQGNWRASVSLALLAGLSASGMLYALAKASTDDAPEHRAAGAWLAAWSKGQGIARPTVMSRKTWVAFYSGGRIAELPDGDLDFVRARIAEKEADVVIVDERWAVPNRKALAPLLDPGKAPPDFVPVHVITTPKKLVVYDIRAVRDVH
jgi:hypothetical protein